MDILEKGVLERLAKALATLPGEKEVRYSRTKDFEISESNVFESLSFSSLEYDHGLVITERKDGSFEIRVPLRWSESLLFTKIEDARYLYTTAVGGYVVSREPDDPKVTHSQPEALGHVDFLKLLLAYFGQLSFLEPLLDTPIKLH